MNLSKVFENKDLLVIDKPAGLMVHPGAGENETNLSRWFVEKYPDIKKVNWPIPERAGIVHRIDKDTSGLIILAKNSQTLAKLQEQFKEHLIIKKYTALVYGVPNPEEGEISGLIARDPNNRQKQKVQLVDFGLDESKKRESLTKYKVIEKFIFKKEKLCLVEAQIFTGRTHQVRVHLKFIGYPIIGDQKYFTKPSRRISKKLGVDRQFLHARYLKFQDPRTGDWVELKSDLPEDLKSIINKIKAWRISALISGSAAAAENEQLMRSSPTL